MNNMKRILLIIFSITALAGFAKVPQSVARAVKQANEAAAMEVRCDINDMPATLTMSGDCFIMDFGEAKIYYDGTTQWAYNVPDAEVTIVEPTEEELSEINPLRILQRLEADYDGTVVSGNPNSVRLTPKTDTSDIAEVAATFSEVTGWPVSLTVITASGRADISNISFTTSAAKTPVSAFKFKAPSGVTIIDLR